MKRKQGFTLIELLVVLAVVALMLSIALPRYMATVDKAKESALAENLRAVRVSLDKYKADRGRWPQSLDELVSARYLTALPTDPMTESASTWNLVHALDGDDRGISDIQSGAAGVDRAGKAYAAY